MCDNSTQIHSDGDPVLSVMMFAAGVVGNLMALVILGVHQRGRPGKASVFSILVTALVLTDLLGTCVVSPPAFIAYARNTSLVGLAGPAGSRGFCNVLAFSMTFFGLASMLILFAMAVERCLAISHPYIYSKHMRTSFAKVALTLVYLLSGSFCSLPLLVRVPYKQYCPGTWCFLRMEGKELAISLAYISVMALLITAICLCNTSVIVSLCRMYHSHLVRQGPAARKGVPWFRRGEEELDHLVLLGSMTIIFIICTLPLTDVGLTSDLEGAISYRQSPSLLWKPRKSSVQVCGFVCAILPANDQKMLLALRFFSLNPILDPWVFIIFRKVVFQRLHSLLRCCLRGPRAPSDPPSSMPLNTGQIFTSTILPLGELGS
ncbi:prostacyclin receptor-like isoform X1 [Megalops cyprinoides]|uniref:prostacyclin receptor-like isoform X1 n=1 Tax=Megalops cyprinoides TaxID=118141 RepID=UPI001863C6AD|nr:prostacyclin receptor-like isoform X1 [Megalops cyprinoides]